MVDRSGRENLLLDLVCHPTFDNISTYFLYGIDTSFLTEWGNPAHGFCNMLRCKSACHHLGAESLKCIVMCNSIYTIFVSPFRYFARVVLSWAILDGSKSISVKRSIICINTNSPDSRIPGVGERIICAVELLSGEVPLGFDECLGCDSFVIEKTPCCLSNGERIFDVCWDDDSGGGHHRLLDVSFHHFGVPFV